MNLTISNVVNAVIVITVVHSLGSYFYRLFTVPNSPRKLQAKKKAGKRAQYSDVPGPVGVPFLGIIPFVYKHLPSNLHLILEEVNERYGSICRFYLGIRHIISVDDALMTKTILNNPDAFERSNLFLFAVDGLQPYALFAMKGDIWRKHRKGLQPAFAPMHLRGTFDVTKESVEYLLSIWEKQAENGVIERDVKSDYFYLSRDLLGKISFSLDLGALRGIENNMHPDDLDRHAKRLVDWAEQRARFYGLPFQGVLLWLVNCTIAQAEPSIKFMHEMFGKVLDEKLTQGSQNKDLLDRIINSDKFSRLEMISEISGFFFAGGETVPDSVTWTFYELLKCPHALKKLVEEIDTVLNYGKETFTYDTLPKFKYLDAVCKESLRFHSTQPINWRDCVKDTVLTTSDGIEIEIPKGTECFINLTRIHTSEKYYGPNAKEFYPDRWLDEEFVPVPGSYIPFGDGEMNCIGQKMAIVELKTLLVLTLQRYTVAFSENQGEIDTYKGFAIKIKDKLLLKFTPR